LSNYDNRYLLGIVEPWWWSF